MDRRAIASTKLHELIGKPHQGRTVGIHAGQEIQHLVRIADTLRKKLAFLFLKANLRRHLEAPFCFW
jgi:hypothetical protein